MVQMFIFQFQKKSKLYINWYTQFLLLFIYNAKIDSISKEKKYVYGKNIALFAFQIKIDLYTNLLKKMII